MSKLQDELRRNGQIPIGDQLMVYRGEWRLLRPGDTYLGHTEGDEPDVLTVRRIEVQKRNVGGPHGKVFPKERKKKLYDLDDVVKIIFIDNPNLDTENKPDERITEQPDRVTVRDDSDEPVHPEPTPSVPRGAEAARAVGPNRPVPRAPSRGGATDYSKAARRAQQAAERRASGDGDSVGGDK